MPDDAVFLSENAVFLSGGETPPARTLVEILEETTRAHPGAPALDDGRVVLSYAGLRDEAGALAGRLRAAGAGPGERVGVRVPSGTADLYVAILAVLTAGAAYVPVDADDPDERAELVFGEAGVRLVVGEGRALTFRGETEPEAASTRTPGTGDAGPVVPGDAGSSAARGGRAPRPGDDAWVIFTSGSTGKPKGVAVSHRSAAAFVDAEARLFLQEAPIGTGDRVLAGLSVAFDASCEEMWLAWRYGACLVPAPRALVRAGMDLGPWLVERGVTIVSTVPTLAALWPVETLDEVRLLIFGGEACPPELAERLSVPGREVWNTYGPTEATVVACAAPLGGPGPVRIGLPLHGWDLAVVGPDGEPVASGGTGELVIGGVGLARYLDPVKDAEKYAPLPSLGWERAYRSGDLVVADPEGLIFVGRADDQVKLGGRRVELGEIDAALSALPGVVGAAAAVRTTGGGHQLLVGYVVPGDPGAFDAAAARERLAGALPAALVPRLAVVDDLPTRTSGKIDRAALPWPLAALDADASAEPSGELSETERWLAERWHEVLGDRVTGPGADFFTAGGTSLAAARLVSALRTRHASIAVADLYDHPTLRGLAARLEELEARAGSRRQDVDDGRRVAPMPRRASLTQTALTLPLLTVRAMPWVIGAAVAGNLLGLSWTPVVSWWWVLAGVLLFMTPFGRLGLAAAMARLLLRGLRPGDYPRGGAVHLRIWFTDKLTEMLGVAGISSAPWITHYARALGAQVGQDADLHTLPPVTGMLRLGRGASIEPEVDLTGHWLDGDVLHVGEIRVGARAGVGARSTLLPGTRIGKNAQVAPGSSVSGPVPAGERWAGAPATRQGKAAPRAARPPRLRRWSAIYGVSASLLGLVPLVAAIPGLAVLGAAVQDSPALGAAIVPALLAVPVATVVSMAAMALLLLVLVRLLGVGLRAGDHPVHSRPAWQAWATERLMAMARVWLFPLYASLFTPLWLRALGMKVGRQTEISTVLALPKMTTVGDGAFLADDTMIAPYELAGGWMRVDHVRIGKRAFVGNSGMTAPGRKVPKDGLVGVLSAAPKKAKAGSSYLGMPPVKLRRTAQRADTTRTYDPPLRLRVARALVELCRAVPAMATAGLGVPVLAALMWLAGTAGFAVAALLGGVVLAGAGVVAGGVAVGAKWALLGRISAGDRPLWSSFVWRNELADNFVEVLAAPWFATPWLGTAPFNAWLRALGARIGRGVWCETYWLPEIDLVSLGDGTSVNRGCVLQTHLFHDRVMSIDTVELAEGSTLGPHGVVLPAATVGSNTTIGPASLVMRGESLPARTRWYGNPVAAWHGAA
ncbi:amino acid adenylation domain-containing protein [Sphaerisporangium album]|uniref:Amino acid adenylation domain-containing protein n=1 Tax=Sphaerisporangium album TaxID=509200 RepID=A0A367F9Q9_9ACTN|nr:amino acid adenylation domain-containing protein [Sphaerisporangium album]